MASAALLLVLFAGLAIASLRHKSVTTDEIMYIAAGHYHLRTGQWDLNLTNPPLLKLIPALPLLALDLDLPAVEGDPGRWKAIEQWQYSRRFLYDNRVSHERILLVARLPVVLLGVLLGVGVFLWSRSLYGDVPGLASLALYALSPNVLAHTRLATLDLGVTAFMFFAAWAFWGFLRRPGLLRLAGAALLLSAAVLTKTTAAFLLPALAAAALWCLLQPGEQGLWRRAPGVAGLAERSLPRAKALSLAHAALAGGVIALIGLNLAYPLRETFHPFAEDRDHERAYARLPAGATFLRPVVKLALETPLPIPRPFLGVVKFQASKTSSGNRVYLRGETSQRGWKHLMLLATGIKTPLALLVGLVALAVVWLRRRSLDGAEILLLTSIATIFALFSYMSNVAVGLRYVLPAWPCLHVLCGRLVRDVSGRWATALLCAGGLWYASAAARIHPHYLAYFNEIVGPEHGHEWLADSFLDWGQDLPGLRAYMEERGLERIRLAYFGSGDARAHGIAYDYLPSVGLAPRQPGESWWYEPGAADAPPFEWDARPVALSATLRAGVFYPGYYRAFHGLEPSAQVGYSILIYEPPVAGDAEARRDATTSRPVVTNSTSAERLTNALAAR